MDDLVQASGLSKGSLYWHFDSKLEVFLGVFDLIMERIARGLDEIEARTERVPDALRAQCAYLIETLAGERALLFAWSEFLNHPEARRRMAEIYRWSRQRLSVAIDRGVERGEVRSAAAGGLPSTLTALVEGMLLQAMMDEAFDPVAAFSPAWDVLMEGMRP
jgi:AcrR family transcriptional regulator